MPADSELATLYAQRYTASALAIYLDAALEAARESKVVSRSYQGSSMTIQPETARQTALDLGEALTIRQASEAATNTDPALTASPISHGPDFSTRQIL